MLKNMNVSHWTDLVKAGDSVAANRIWLHYFDRLVRSVRAQLQEQNRAVSDKEGIVLSVFDSSKKRCRKWATSEPVPSWRTLAAAAEVGKKRRREVKAWPAATTRW